MNPNRAKKAEAMATLAALKRRLRKIRTGSIGCSTRSSWRTKRAMNAAETPNPARVPGLVQPHEGASMIVKTSPPIAAIEVTKPTLSSEGASVSADSGTIQATAPRATTMIGTLT